MQHAFRTILLQEAKMTSLVLQNQVKAVFEIIAENMNPQHRTLNPKLREYGARLEVEDLNMVAVPSDCCFLATSSDRRFSTNWPLIPA